MPRNKSPQARENDLKRQKNNFITLGCVVKRAEGEAFRAWCAARGSNVRAELLAYVRQCIGQ